MMSLTSGNALMRTNLLKLFVAAALSDSKVVASGAHRAQLPRAGPQRGEARPRLRFRFVGRSPRYVPAFSVCINGDNVVTI